MLEFFEKNNTKNLGAAYRMIKQNDTLNYDDFLKLVLELSQRTKQNTQKADNSP